MKVVLVPLYKALLGENFVLENEGVDQFNRSTILLELTAFTGGKFGLTSPHRETGVYVFLMLLLPLHQITVVLPHLHRLMELV